MAGRLPSATGPKAREGAQGLKVEALSLARGAGVAVPSILDKHGREEWRRVLSALVPRQNLSVVDLGSVEMMCVEYQNWKRAEIEIAEAERVEPGSGVYAVTPNGHRQQSAARIEARAAMREYRRWAMLIGATPVARIKTNGTAQGDLFDRGARQDAAEPDDRSDTGPFDPTDPYSQVTIQ